MTLFSKEDIFLVTGASSGIGRQTAIDLIKEGATVVGIARNKEKLENTKQMSICPERFFIEIKDFSKNLEDIDEFVSSLREKYGKLRGLVYCAGIMNIQPTRMLSYAEMLNTFNINYFAPVLLAKAVIDKRNNIGGGTSIVGVSSIAAIISDKGMTTYSGTKSGLSASYKCIAKEVVSKGIRVNTVLPSDIKTPMTMNENVAIIREEREQMYPLGFGEPNDVSNMIIYLLSDKAKWLTAQSYIIDCGSI